MSYGTAEKFRSKKAFREAVAARGAADVRIYSTSAFGDETARTVAEVADTSAVIVGPDVECDRRWYANVKTKGGKIVVV